MTQTPERIEELEGKGYVLENKKGAWFVFSLPKMQQKPPTKESDSFTDFITNKYVAYTLLALVFLAFAYGGFVTGQRNALREQVEIYQEYLSK